MNFKNKDLKRILNWFDLAETNLSDEDLELYDEIKEYLNDNSKDDDEVSFEDDFLEDYEEFNDDDEEYEDWISSYYISFQFLEIWLISFLKDLFKAPTPATVILNFSDISLSL